MPQASIFIYGYLALLIAGALFNPLGLNMAWPELRHFIPDLRSGTVLIPGLLMALCFLLLSKNTAPRKVEKSASTLMHAPTGITPGLAYFFLYRSYDTAALVADLLELARRGLVHIVLNHAGPLNGEAGDTSSGPTQKSAHGYVLRLPSGVRRHLSEKYSTASGLSSHDHLLLKKLFAGCSEIVLPGEDAKIAFVKTCVRMRQRYGQECRGMFSGKTLSLLLVSLLSLPILTAIGLASPISAALVIAAGSLLFPLFRILNFSRPLMTIRGDLHKSGFRKALGTLTVIAGVGLVALAGAYLPSSAPSGILGGAITCLLALGFGMKISGDYCKAGFDTYRKLYGLRLGLKKIETDRHFHIADGAQSGHGTLGLYALIFGLYNFRSWVSSVSLPTPHDLADIEGGCPSFHSGGEPTLDADLFAQAVIRNDLSGSDDAAPRLGLQYWFNEDEWSQHIVEAEWGKSKEDC